MLYVQIFLAWYFQRVNNIRILYETSLQEMRASCIRHLGLECFLLVSKTCLGWVANK